MRIPFNHPYHRFQPVNLPPMPSATGRRFPVYQCADCGMSGVADDKLVHFYVGIGQGMDMNRVRNCNPSKRPANVSYSAIITCANLHTRGPEFSHLLPGTLHRLAPPPDTDNSQSIWPEGIWVSGPHGPVKLLAGEFLPMTTRKRTPRHIAAE